MKILFLGETNACRTQMAEAWSKQMNGDDVEVLSAGMRSHGKNPRAVTSMLEVNIDITKQESSLLTVDMTTNLDFLITFDTIDKEKIPNLSDFTQMVHWSIENPAKQASDREQMKQHYRQTRDQIRDMILSLYQRLGLTIKSSDH